jgi:hypothetical protein
MKTCYWFLFVLLMPLCSVVHAQTACPPGMEEYGAGVCGYSQSEEPAQQARPQQPALPPPQWATRWGAIATDSPKGVLGAVVNVSSKSEAQQAAMADCKAKGGTKCKVDIAYDNECAAVVVGDGGYNVGSDATTDKASQLGMNVCTKAGRTNCHVYYSACSLPIRIQ